MALLAKPTKFPEWARVPSVDPVVGGDNVVEPPEQQKDEGWARKQLPPANYMNWLHNLTNEWLEYLDSVVGESVFTTGDWKFTDKLAADIESGWIVADDGTLGTVGSAADHQGEITRDLYVFYYDRYDDTICPVSGGRSGDANADFDADRTLTIPLKLSRMVMVSGAGAGLTPRPPGDLGGEELHTITEPELAAHPHPRPLSLQAASPGSGTGRTGGDNTYVTTATDPAGSNVGHNTVAPYSASIVFIKL